MGYRLAVAMAALGLATGCSRSNNLLLGRVEAVVAGRTVVVTDCYRTSVPPPEPLDAANHSAGARFAPCRDAVVVIRGNELSVNGQSYGAIGADAAVLVDHGKVSIEKLAKR